MWQASSLEREQLDRKSWPRLIRSGWKLKSLKPKPMEKKSRRLLTTAHRRNTPFALELGGTSKKVSRFNARAALRSTKASNHRKSSAMPSRVSTVGYSGSQAGLRIRNRKSSLEAARQEYRESLAYRERAEKA